MKKFLVRFGTFLSLFVLWLGIYVAFNVFVVRNQYEGNYNASIQDKIAYMHQIEEPKIILVGNSNVAFGMNSEMLEQAIGMPVVNLGLHGDMGNAFHENMAKSGIREGDIVIVCHSYYAGGSDINDPSLAWITLEKNFDLWSIVPSHQYRAMFRALPNYLIDSFELWLTGRGNQVASDNCYSRLAFNKYGDVVVKPDALKASSNYILRLGVGYPAVDQGGANRLNEYNAFITEKKATLLIAGYPIADGEKTPDKSVFEAFQAKLESMVDCEVISDFCDYFMPYEYFYNTHLHLTKEGADLRTKQLIADLERWFDSRK